jgi:cytochrome c oxidase subunit 2
VGRFWSILFLLVPIVGVAVFAWALFGWWPIPGHWLPENINDHGRVIDNLFMFILWLTGVIFVATGVVLFWFMWKYDAARHTEPVIYMHGSHTLEVIWSIIPAAVLVFIAIFQMSAWADAKLKRPLLSNADGIIGNEDDVPLPALVKVTGRQFEWRIRYAGEDGIIGNEDDVQLVNDLHLPVNEELVVQIESQDVLHSFFLPNMRIKQDVVPGMKQFVWFRANKVGLYDIVCAELCGWGHYKMRGRLTIESRAEFDRWLKSKWDEQNQAAFVPPPKGDE